MKNSIFIFSFIITSSLRAQTYSPLAVDSAVWIIQQDDYLTTPWIDTYYGYYMNGDTVEGSYTYKKVYKLYFSDETPVWTLPYHLDSMKLFALVRESSKMIYAKQFYPTSSCALNSEYLLYDFNYAVGGSASNLCIEFEVNDTIKSIGTNTTYSRKNFITDANHEFIEGIGSEFGLFEAIGTNVSSGIYQELFNYCQGALSVCNIVTGIDKLTDAGFEFYPNPADRILNLEVPEKYIGANTEVIDVYGRLHYQKPIATTKTCIELDLRPGIYFFRLTDDKHHSFTRKFVIAR